MNPHESSKKQVVKNPLAVMQQGEETLCEIHRHPFGLLVLYAGAGFFLIAISVFAFILAPNIFGSGNQLPLVIIGFLFFFLTVLCLIFVFVSTIVYVNNNWVVTTDSVTQIQQLSLFRKDSAQLSMGNLEDVSAEKVGVFSHIFNYGTLRAETAGERSKFVFPYCPRPHYYAQLILAAREDFVQTEGKTKSHEPGKSAKKPSKESIGQLGQAALNDYPEVPQPPLFPPYQQ